MKSRERAVAPCGIDCYFCEFYGNNLSEGHRNYLASFQKIKPEEVLPCKGCRDQKGCLIHPVCDTYDCVQEKQVAFCYECDDFPCVRLHPAADRAGILPHNLKVYNLCRIRAIGPERWTREESEHSRELYYKGTIVIGAGPSLKTT